MKRIICVIISAGMICLCSCQREPAPLKEAFSADFRVVSDGIEYAGRLELDGSDMTVTMTAPETVKGVGFSYTEQGLSIGFGGLMTEVESGYIPARAVPSALYGALPHIGQAVYDGSDGELDSYILPTPNGSAQLTAKDGTPVGLNDHYTGLTFEFETE